MKNIVISADGDRKVYAVADDVAENLETYCLKFCTWLQTSPQAKKYRVCGVLHYNEDGFIDYLNKWVFPKEPALLVENLGWIDFDAPLPKKYKDCAEFRF